MPGIRPGDQTADYIDGVMTRLTVWGSSYLILVCLMPQFLIVSANVPLFRGYFFINCSGSCNGFYGTSSITFDVASIRIAS